ncbi:MAG: cupin domain-containing protein [Paracoccaceae bacterium]
MKHLLSAVLLCSASTALSDTSILLRDADQMAWETTPQGVAFAPLLGARFSEEYMAMVRLPAGTVSPPHVKSANMFGVMVQGRMTHVPVNASAGPATQVGPGGFYKVPAGLPHVSSCVSAEPCIAFLYQDGAFDFLPVSQ